MLRSSRPDKASVEEGAVQKWRLGCSVPRVSLRGTPPPLELGGDEGGRYLGKNEGIGARLWPGQDTRAVYQVRGTYQVVRVVLRLDGGSGRSR